jgi:hypothetical protein
VIWQWHIPITRVWILSLFSELLTIIRYEKLQSIFTVIQCVTQGFNKCLEMCSDHNPNTNFFVNFYYIKTNTSLCMWDTHICKYQSFNVIINVCFIIYFNTQFAFIKLSFLNYLQWISKCFFVLIVFLLCSFFCHFLCLGCEMSLVRKK